MKKSKHIEPLCYSVTTAAMTLGVSSRTARKHAREGKIAHFRIEKMILIPADVLREFIESRPQTN